MKLRNLLIIVAVCSCLSGMAQEAIFNVATYNIRQLNDGDTRAGNGWERRMPIIASLAQFHDFDIFGTQEGFSRQLEDLRKSMPGYAYIGAGRDDGKSEGEHSAIFYRTDLFDLIDHGDFWLSETPDTPSMGWDAVCRRICTWGKFRHRPSGREFLFFNLHMDHIGKTARIESAKLVKAKMDEFGTGLPILLTGDFNVDQTHGSYSTIIGDGRLNDAYAVSRFVYALNGTFNSYHTDGFSASRIDHIFVSPDITVRKYGVLTDTYRTEETAGTDNLAANAPAEIAVNAYVPRTPSDHFPVKAVVELK